MERKNDCREPGDRARQQSREHAQGEETRKDVHRQVDHVKSLRRFGDTKIQPKCEPGEWAGRGEAERINPTGRRAESRIVQ